MTLTRARAGVTGRLAAPGPMAIAAEPIAAERSPRGERAVALSPLKLLSLRAGSAQARQTRPIARKHRLGRGRGARLLFQFLDGESKLPCPFDYELHLTAYTCKEKGIVLM